MWNPFETKPVARPNEGEDSEWSKLEARVKALEEKTAEVLEIPVQWATTTAQLRRLVGHITKTNALDRLPPAAPSTAEPARTPLTQEELIANMNRAQ